MRHTHTQQRLKHTASSSRWSAAFTLLEVLLAMTLALLIIGISALSISSIQDEAKLKRVAAGIEGSARQALADAINKQRPVRLALDGSLAAGGQVMVKRYGEHKFRTAQGGEFWEFSPDGVCEPIEIQVTHELGEIELAFDPLTGMARRRGIVVRG